VFVPLGLYLLRTTRLTSTRAMYQRSIDASR
jgi:hypothetical protein